MYCVNVQLSDYYGSGSLDEVQLPLVPVYDNIVGYTDILDDVHFDIEFTIHSWPSGDWANIFQCGTENMERYPGLFIHPDSGIDGDSDEGLHVMVADGDGNKVGGLMGDALSLETLYHVEVHFTQSWYTVVVNDETLYDGAKAAHPTTYHMPCYSSFPQHSAADVTITALSMSSSMLLSVCIFHKQMMFPECSENARSASGATICFVNARPCRKWLTLKC